MARIIEIRRYFPASATQEILDEFRPMLCPMSSPTILSAIQYLEIFLPVCVKPEEAPVSYELWFEELMTLWNACHNASAWEDVCFLKSRNFEFYNLTLVAHDVDDGPSQQLHHGLPQLGALHPDDVRSIFAQFPAAGSLQTKANRQAIQNRDFVDGDVDLLCLKRRQKLHLFPPREVHAGVRIVLLSG